MPAAANAICSMRPKLVPLRTAKPLSMEAAAETSSRKYQVLRVNLSFISSLPPAEGRRLPHQFLEFSNIITHFGACCVTIRKTRHKFHREAHMNAVFSILLLAAILGFIVFLLSKKDQNRRSQYGPSGLSEFRTDLPLDDCFDRLDQHSPDDVLRLRVPPGERRRLHPPPDAPNSPPSSRWTPSTPPVRPGPPDHRDPHLHPEAFGYKEPLFPARDAGRVHAAQVRRPPHKIIPAKGFAFF